MDDLAQFLRVKLPTITQTVHVQATYLPNYIEVYVPRNPYEVIPDGWENSQPVERSNRGQGQNKEENRQTSMRKSKRRIKNLALNNHFELWVTLTMANDRYDDEKTLRKLRNWLHSEKRRVGIFDYLLVPERHKDGALHFHGLIGNYKGKLTPAVNAKTRKQLFRAGREVFNLATYNLGFTDVERVENPERIASYITKYITKDMPTIGLNKKRYWASRTLEHPKVEVNPLWFLSAKGKHTEAVELEHGTIYKYPTSVVQHVLPLNSMVQRVTESG